MEAVVVVEEVLDVEAGSDVEVDRLVGAAVLAAADDEVDGAVAAPGGEQANITNKATTLSRIAIL